MMQFTLLVLLLSPLLVFGDETVDECVDFVVENMAARDKIAVIDELVRRNAELALEARRANKWAQSVPWRAFLEYVLPPTVLDEPRDFWRPLLRSKMAPLVSGSPDLLSAFQAVNSKLWSIFDVTFFSNSTPGIRSPFETIANHHASCTGVAILLVDCLRSVGVPARLAGACEWNTPSKGNHNWAEVMLDDGTWSFVEPMRNDLNRTWFFPEPAKRQVPGSELNGIWAATFLRRTANGWFPMAWSLKDTGFPAVDVTQVYLDAK